MLVLSDQAGFTVSLSLPATRIVSLVPSQTELLSDLGLADEVVGITKFCVHPPEWFHRKTRVGGTKNPHLSAIRALQPDLILANKEENAEAHIRELQKEFPVYTSDVSSIQQNNEMIKDIGLLTNKQELAASLVKQIESLYLPGSQAASLHLKRALYLIWREPWLSVGSDTFIHDMMKYAGFENSLANHTRYPEIDLRNWQGLPPEYILLSSEPYPFQAKHIPEIQAFFPESKILLVDGEYFSWYGSRPVKAAAYFQELKAAT